MMDEQLPPRKIKVQIYRGLFYPASPDVQLPACLNSNQTEATYARQIVDKGRFVHAGYGMNALFGYKSRQIQYIAEMM